MAFQDNSGDIILDSVLTDEGRARLARGDGSFKISKFALVDDEVDYGLYDKTHVSGTAYYDLNILSTPMLEAFTDNTAFGHSRLLSIPRNDLLYLPILKLNEVFDSATKRYTDGMFLVAADEDTEKSAIGNDVVGTMFGNSQAGGTYIRVDQGLDTTEVSAKRPLDPDLKETHFIIQMDNRFGSIISVNNQVNDVVAAKVSFVDDDNVATYALSLNTDGVLNGGPGFVLLNTTTETSNLQTISGPRGSILQFRIASSVELSTSDYLFTQLGSTATIEGVASTKYIDSYVRVIGATTGYKLDIPVRFVKIP